MKSNKPSYVRKKFILTGIIFLFFFLSLRLVIPLISPLPQWVNNTPPALEDTSSRPNFVSSLSSTSERKIEPISFSENSNPEELLIRLEKSIPNHFRRWRFVRSGQGWVHFEVKTPMMGYVDDVVLSLPSDKSKLYFEVKSSSRLGHSDLGANRRRVEKLRNFFEKLKNEAD